MSEGGDNIIGVRTVYEAVLRLEGALESHRNSVNNEIDDLRTQQAYMRGRIDGSLGMIKWLGPTGIVALIVGIVFLATNGHIILGS